VENPPKLIDTLKRNQWIVQAQTEGLSHQDSLLQLPFRGNCLNWVLGHIAVNRDKMLVFMGRESLLDEGDYDAYRRGAQPILTDEGTVSLEALLEALAQLAERLEAGLERCSPGALAEVVDEKHGFTLGDRLWFLLWHETYHLGQLEYLRQLAGKDDSIIA
jgi:uncharacterized damage-inducible protein DinB